MQLGVARVRVDLLTGITGVTWEEAWDGRARGEFGGVPVAFIGLSETRRNKLTTGARDVQGPEGADLRGRQAHDDAEG